LKNSKGFSFNVTNGQINISNDHSVLKAELHINSKQNSEDPLICSLKQLIESLQRDELVKNIELKQELSARAKVVLEDASDNELTPKKLNRFYQFLANATPAMQASSTICGVISAVNDAIQLFMRTHS
jgi:hypothetical protein